MKFLDVYRELIIEEKCLRFLENMRWPDGVSASPANQIAVPDAPKLTGIVEANETYIRGKQRGPTSSFQGYQGSALHNRL